MSQATVFADVPEKELVGLTSRSDVLRVGRPIHGLDSRRVLVSGSTASPGGTIVDADLGVVRSNSKEFTARRARHNLNPSLGILKFLGGTVSHVNVDDTIVSSNDSLFVRSHNDTTGALGIGLLTHGAGILLDGDRARGDVVSLHAFTGLMVPNLDLVIISRGDNAVGVLASKTPDLTVVVRFHDDFLLLGLEVDVLEETVTGSDEHVSVTVINGTNHGSEGHGLLGGHGGAIPDHDVSVFTSSEEHVVDAADGRDGTSLVGRDDLFERVILPDEDASVGASSVEGTFGIGGADAVRHG